MGMECPHCGTIVWPDADGICPACRGNTRIPPSDASPLSSRNRVTLDAKLVRMSIHAGLLAPILAILLFVPVMVSLIAESGFLFHATQVARFILVTLGLLFAGFGYAGIAENSLHDLRYRAGLGILINGGILLINILMMRLR